MSEHRNIGFTILELLVAMAVTSLIVVMLLQIIGISSSRWKTVNDSNQAYQAARAAFDSLTRTLSQATLNTEYDYYDTARRSRLALAATPDETQRKLALEAFKPDAYGRSSALHFISGKSLVGSQHAHALFFQAPMDFDTSGAPDTAAGQLNAIGYFIRFGDDAANRPPNVSASNPPPKERFRLFQYLQPTGALDTYREAAGNAWFKNDADSIPTANTHVLAENIVVLAILPKLPAGAVDALAPDYEYDSRTPWGSGAQPVQMHQLPPVVRLLMVAIDEASAARNPSLGSQFGSLFQKPAQYDADLAIVESALSKAGANFRIFQTDVPVRAAKWSE